MSAIQEAIRLAIATREENKSDVIINAIISSSHSKLHDLTNDFSVFSIRDA